MVDLLFVVLRADGFLATDFLGVDFSSVDFLSTDSGTDFFADGSAFVSAGVLPMRGVLAGNEAAFEIFACEDFVVDRPRIGVVFIFQNDFTEMNDLEILTGFGARGKPFARISADLAPVHAKFDDLCRSE